MSRSIRTRINLALALIFSLAAFAGSLRVSAHIYEGIPHLEDEIAYWWQAQVAARGQLTVPSPPEHKSFLVPFVVDYHGRRFAKYPLGWPVVLGLAMLAGKPALANALLAALAVWLTFRLGERLWRAEVGLLAAGLTVTSPFFWLNSGSLLSHPLGLALSAAFALLWLDTTGDKPIPRALPILAGATLGALALTRPWTAVAVAFPFALHGLWILWRGAPIHRKRALTVAVTAAAIGSLHFVWQWAVTGNPLMNPYTLWWPYDKIGFGKGHGVTPQGHNWHLAVLNTKISLRAGYSDLFGWGRYSWIFIPFGLIAAARKPRSWPVLGVVFSLIAFYMAYWVGAWLYGPRYYYEGLYSLALLTALGVFWLAGAPLEVGVKLWENWVPSRLRFWRAAVVAGLLALLVVANLRWYLPTRLNSMRGLYGISREQIKPFTLPEVQALAPAVVFVHPKRWTEYGGLLVLEDPWLTTPFIFVWSRGPRSDAHIRAAFPNRTPIVYFPEHPYEFIVLKPSNGR